MRHYFTTTIVKNRRDVTYGLRYTVDIRELQRKDELGLAICSDKKRQKNKQDAV